MDPRLHVVPEFVPCRPKFMPHKASANNHTKRISCVNIGLGSS